MRAPARIATQLLTGADNTTHDLGRWAAVLSFLAGIGLQVYVVVWRAQAFDFSTFGAGVAIMAAGLGAMLKLKETTEPKPQPPQPTEGGQ